MSEVPAYPLPFHHPPSLLQTLGIPLEALAMADSNQPGLEAQRKQAGMTKEAPPNRTHCQACSVDRTRADIHDGPEDGPGPSEFRPKRTSALPDRGAAMHPAVAFPNVEKPALASGCSELRGSRAPRSFA